MRHKPGARVLIIEDCRAGGTATGKTGVYEGDFPITVVVCLAENEFREWDYEAYTSGTLKMADGTPVKDVVKMWERGQPNPEYPYAFPHENPRIRLDDGSMIWGCQCWWG